MNKPEKFYDWLYSVTFHTNYDRYDRFMNGWGVVIVAEYGFTEELRDAVDDLDGGDMDAIEAYELIESMDNIVYASNSSPAKAMQEVEDLLYRWWNDINDKTC